MRNKF